ncbi:MAG TPA: polysaccharide pyruvyl transferase family protein [Rhodocyclaceae bacterium]|nr:polysaccharide pyruvyl transferase family protein [Rhodocyclaceae bacterium]
MTVDPRLVLFGPFDRHNLGDLLFPHLLAERFPGREILYAGLAARDLRACGGHRVRAIRDLAEGWEGPPAELLHVGGEILDCDAWTAAVMLCARNEAADTVARLDADVAGRAAWAARFLGTPSPAPYVLDKAALPWCGWVGFHGVGGVDLGRRHSAFQRYVADALSGADCVGVRDSVSLAAVRKLGVAARLEPDAAMALSPGVRTRIRSAAASGEAAAIRQAFPAGYLAVQFSADFGDDGTLDLLAAGLHRRIGAQAIAFVRMGAAPWHDDPEPYGRLGFRLGVPCRVFASLDVWQIAALVAGAAGWIGSSLHGAILARGFHVPAVGLERAPGEGRKIRAWAADWAPDFKIVAPRSFADEG